MDHLITAVLSFASAICSLFLLVNHLTNKNPSYIALNGSNKSFNKVLDEASIEALIELLKDLMTHPQSRTPFMQGSVDHYKKVIEAQIKTSKTLKGSLSQTGHENELENFLKYSLAQKRILNSKIPNRIFQRSKVLQNKNHTKLLKSSCESV